MLAIFIHLLYRNRHRQEHQKGLMVRLFLFLIKLTPTALGNCMRLMPTNIMLKLPMLLLQEILLVGVSMSLLISAKKRRLKILLASSLLATAIVSLYPIQIVSQWKSISALPAAL